LGLNSTIRWIDQEDWAIAIQRRTSDRAKFRTHFGDHRDTAHRESTP